MIYKVDFKTVPPTVEPQVLTLCAWKTAKECVGVIKPGSNENGVSHGICEECLKLMFGEREELKFKGMEKIK